MKAILLLISVSLWVLAETISFDSFKQKALEDANILKQAKLDKDIVEKEVDISLSFSNPSMEVGISRYKNSDDKGLLVGLSQPVRTPWFGSDLKDLNSAKGEVAKASYLQAKAQFSKNLEMFYTSFVYQKELESLLLMELKLAKRIEDIAKNRLQNGVGTKTAYLRASIESGAIENRLLFQKQQTKEYYFKLLTYSSIDAVYNLEAKFIYPVSRALKSKTILNPDLLKAQKEQKRLEFETKTLSNSIKTFDISAGYEKEPEDKIISIGASVDLPIFGVNREKEQLSRIKANQNRIFLNQLEIKQNLQKTLLQSSLKTLTNQHKGLQTQQIEQEKLLKLYEEGYKISKGSLLELIEVKNTLLQTSKSLLDIKQEANLKQIELNYIQGNYNE